ncbi:hypothetical protein FD755_010944 [Muntiacus reevesi]|uniref:PLD-like domain-containing protein n=1 Tax=Muntiacus reevesi TaxID=9886 RepID=A0A5N3XRD6_MUNRE|nr:hypothetical protein FD755_010944 [Muntiacus reevesi]
MLMFCQCSHRITERSFFSLFLLLSQLPSGRPCILDSQQQSLHIGLQVHHPMISLLQDPIDLLLLKMKVTQSCPTLCDPMDYLHNSITSLHSRACKLKLLNAVYTHIYIYIYMKELGVIFYNCSCLVLDLQRIFALYSSLKFKNRVPQTWSKRLYGVYDNEKKLQLQLNETKSQAFVSNSPKLFCPKNRSFDIDAIYSVIDDAKQYVYIAVMDYLPISSTSTKRTYWPDLDGKIREALVLRSVKVRLLISFWKETDPLTFNFISSLKAICTEIANCSLKVKFFDLERENACITKEQRNHTFPRLNRNKYMVTDGAAYIGNFDWVGNDFTQNAGTGLVINQADVRNNTSIIKQLKDVFERDWYSPYARTLQPTKQPNCSSLFRLRLPSNKTAMSNASGKDP